MSKVILKVEVEEDYLKSIKASTNKTSSDIILINATPITESDDVISRQALLRKMNTKTHEYSNGMGFRKEWVELINSMPPVTPKRERSDKE